MRATGPRSTKYKELEEMIDQYYEQLRRKNKKQVERFQTNIRKYVLFHGCSEEDITPEVDMPEAKDDDHAIFQLGPSLPVIRKVEDTLRGKLWRTLLGVRELNVTDYQKQVSKRENIKWYVKIRGDTKRTFLTSQTYNSRVSEERLVRILNSYVSKYGKPYVQGMDAIAAGLLYVMPEVLAWNSFVLLMETHFPLYYYSEDSHKRSLIGAWAGAVLAGQIIPIMDQELGEHLSDCHPFQLYQPCVQSFGAICQPFEEMIRLWDFLFAFGVYLMPVATVAQLIYHKQKILDCPREKLMSTMLGMRMWPRLHARSVIDISMRIIIELKDNHPVLWRSLRLHACDMDVAWAVKQQAAKFGTSASSATAGGGTGAGAGAGAARLESIVEQAR